MTTISDEFVFAEAADADDPIELVWDFTDADVRSTDEPDGDGIDIPDCIIWNIDGAELTAF